MIRSFTNTKVKSVIALRDRHKARKERGAFLVEGIRMLSEVCAEDVLEVYVSESFLENADETVRNKLQAFSDRTEVLTDTVFLKISDTRTPQGVLVVVRQSEWSMQDLLSETTGSRKPLLLLCERIQDPGNLGTMLRTAEAAGATGVIISSDSADPYQPKVVRATMGAILRIPFVITESVTDAVNFCKSQTVPVYAATLENASVYDTISYEGPCAFVIGNEGEGLTQETIAAATDRVRIPMQGQTESLNASVAASILLYEANRQRRKGL